MLEQRTTPEISREVASKNFQIRAKSAEIVRLAVTMFARFALSLRSVEDMPGKRGLKISHKIAVQRPGQI